MALPAGGIVCLVTDRRQLAPEARTTRDALSALERWLDDAIGSGVDLIQVREPDVDAAPLRAVVSAVVARARGSRTAVVVNERADIAMAADAAGVHLPSSGAPEARIRAVGPATWLVGRSVHDTGEAGRPAGADYLLFGTMYESASKPAGTPTQGIARLVETVAASRAPIIAIGGIDPDRALACAAAGAAGVAGIGVFLPPGRAPGALGVARATTALRAAMHEGALRRASSLCLPDSALLE